MGDLSTSILIVIVALAMAALLLLLSLILRRRAGLPEGRIVYADPGMWGKVEKPLYDSTLGLTGKPDYLVKNHNQVIPVEVKSMWAPREPYDSHRLQLGAYCLLVERSLGQRPLYGLLRYRNRTFRIPYTSSFEDEVIGILEDIRDHKDLEEVCRSHEHPNRCARCGYRNRCDQRL